jgi:hypothetical protein
MPAFSAWPRLLRVAVASAAMLASASCGPPPWTPAPHPAPGTLPPDTRLQVWRDGRSVTLREITCDGDSIRGRLVVPLGGFSRARIAIARSDIDSLRQAPRDRDNWFGAGLGVGIIGAIVLPYLIQAIGPRGT